GQSGRGDDDAVDLRAEAGDELLLGARAELGVDQQQLGVAGAGGDLHGADQRREERVLHVGHEHADHAGAAGGQSAGRPVGAVAVLARGGQHGVADGILDQVRPGQRPRDGRRGDPHGLRDRVDRRLLAGAGACHTALLSAAACLLRDRWKALSNIVSQDGAAGPAVGQKPRLTPPASALAWAVRATSVASRLAAVVISGSRPALRASKKYWAGRGASGSEGSQVARSWVVTARRWKAQSSSAVPRLPVTRIR